MLAIEADSEISEFRRDSSTFASSELSSSSDELACISTLSFILSSCPDGVERPSTTKSKHNRKSESRIRRLMQRGELTRYFSQPALRRADPRRVSGQRERRKSKVRLSRIFHFALCSDSCLDSNRSLRTVGLSGRWRKSSCRKNAGKSLFVSCRTHDGFLVAALPLTMASPPFRNPFPVPMPAGFDVNRQSIVGARSKCGIRTRTDAAVVDRARQEGRRDERLHLSRLSSLSRAIRQSPLSRDRPRDLRAGIEDESARPMPRKKTLG